MHFAQKFCVPDWLAKEFFAFILFDKVSQKFQILFKTKNNKNELNKSNCMNCTRAA